MSVALEPPRWRTWRITRRAASWLYRLGIARGTAVGFRGGGPMHLIGVTWVWERRALPPYILGWSRNKWRCLLRYHHWPYWPNGQPVAFGHCGKCAPWPCCDSIEVEHAPECGEEL